MYETAMVEFSLIVLLGGLLDVHSAINLVKNWIGYPKVGMQEFLGVGICHSGIMPIPTKQP